MSLRERAGPGSGIIEPCLPSPAKVPPSGPGWIHEIKHNGFRIMARRDGAGVRLITRHGNDFTSRFALAFEFSSADVVRAEVGIAYSAGKTRLSHSRCLGIVEMS
jgi:ATP-dependent DNA ligase